MARLKIQVRHNGIGWQVATTGRVRPMIDRARPYATREEALSDALFSARMLRALGADVEVLLECSDGMRLVDEEPEQVWLKH